jgi:hypothetical protein
MDNTGHMIISSPGETIFDFSKAETKPDTVGLQDGMLAYYLSQVPFTDWLVERALEGGPFDCRDMMGTEKK